MREREREREKERGERAAARKLGDWRVRQVRKRERESVCVCVRVCSLAHTIVGGLTYTRSFTKKIRFSPLLSSGDWEGAAVTWREPRGVDLMRQRHA